jgi:hypothetical protein
VHLAQSREPAADGGRRFVGQAREIGVDFPYNGSDSNVVLLELR